MTLHEQYTELHRIILPALLNVYFLNDMEATVEVNRLDINIAERKIFKD